MGDVKRYSKDGYHAEHKDGPFVAFEDYARLQARVEQLEAAMLEAKLQIEYMHGKFGETGSGNAVLDTLRRVLCGK